MLVSTEAISLNYVKYSETSIIVKCFTKSDGLKSYLLKGIRTSKKKKINIGFFQPLTHAFRQALLFKSRPEKRKVKEANSVTPIDLNNKGIGPIKNYSFSCTILPNNSS